MTDYSRFTDPELQKLAVKGDGYAEEQLALRYSRLVLICARPLFLRGGDVEDLTQEGMFGLLSAIREFREEGGASFKTFAEYCIRNRLRSAVRMNQSKKNGPLNDYLSLEEILSDETKTKEILPSSAFARTPEDQVLARESEKEIYSTFSRCLSTLESKILRPYLEGRSYREISEETGVAEKSVDNAVQRIRRKLARHFSPGDFS